jgi:hypothetical protein
MDRLGRSSKEERASSVPTVSVKWISCTVDKLRLAVGTKVAYKPMEYMGTMNAVDIFEHYVRSR